MQRVRFHFDVVSPAAYLAFERLPEALAGISHHVEYHPVASAGLPGAAAHAACDGATPDAAELPVQTPAPYPFDPLPLLGLMLSADAAGRLPNRRVVEVVMRHVWQGGGADPNEPQRLRALAAELGLAETQPSDGAMDRLRQLTDGAIARGVTGVPSFEAAGRLHEGLDALSSLRAGLMATPD